MVCYGPRLSTILAATVAGYVLLHQVIGTVLRIAGMVMEIALITSAAAAAAVLVAWTARTIGRRRAAVGGCTSCRFRCQRPLTGEGIVYAGHLLTPDGVAGGDTDTAPLTGSGRTAHRA